MIKNIKKEELSKSGVYKITNLINNKYYIGSSKNVSFRYRTHLFTLKNNVSECTILQKAVNKYGIQNFEFSIVEITSNYKEKEIELMAINLPSYNCIKETFIRREISEETRLKISLAQINAYKNGRVKTSVKGRTFKRNVLLSVLLFNDLEAINFISVEDCAKRFNCTVQAIYKAYKKQGLFRRKYNVKLIEFKK